MQNRKVFTKEKTPLDAIANTRIDSLLLSAKKECASNPARAKRYVQIARALAARHRIPLGLARKKLFCQKCLMPYVHGKGVKVRLRKNKKIEYLCSCGAKKYFLYSGKK